MTDSRSQSDADAPDPLPDVIDRVGPFIVLDEIGTGGMGTVYLARAIEPLGAVKAGQKVALKVMHRHLAKDASSARKRFEREGQLGTRLRHPNVARTYELCEFDIDGEAVPTIVMEYVAGRTLQELIDSKTPINEERLQPIVRQLAAGLSAIHAKNAVHRDLKPANVILMEGEESVVRITDLGVAFAEAEGGRLTNTDTFVGSVAYAAPEQFQHQPVGPAADLFALGVLAYELCTGIHPFQSDSFASTMASILTSTPPPLRERAPDATQFFEQIVHTLLQKDPLERFPSAANLARVLAKGEASEWWNDKPQHEREQLFAADESTSFFGRSDELEQLFSLYRDVKNGTGAAVVVQGAGGMGKSRLVREFIRCVKKGVKAGDEAPHVLIGRPTSDQAHTRYEALARAVRLHYRDHDLGEALSDLWGNERSTTEPFAAFLRGDEGHDRLGVDELRVAFVDLLRSLGKERPTILLLEDIDAEHQADTARLLPMLAPALENSRVLLLATRGVTEPAVDGGMPNLDLHPLDTRDVRALCSEIVGAESLPPQLDDILAAAQGNPLFAVQLVRTLIDKKYICDDGSGGWDVSPRIERFPIPQSIESSFRGALDGLDELLRQTLRAGACVGQRFDLRLVARSLGLREDIVRDQLERIERRQGVVRALAGNVFAFAPELAQRAIYDSIESAERTRLHHIIADACKELLQTEPDTPYVDDVVACRHYLRSDQPEGVLDHLKPGIEKLSNALRSHDAIELARAALEMEDPLPPRLRLDVLALLQRNYELLGRSLDQRDALSDAEEAAEELGGADGAEALARASYLSAWYYISRTDTAHAREELKRADALIDRASTNQAKLRFKCWSAQNWGHVHLYEGKLDESHRVFSRQYLLSLEIQHLAEKRSPQGIDPKILLGMANLRRTQAEGSLGEVAWARGDAMLSLRHRRAQYDSAVRLEKTRPGEARYQMVVSDIGAADIISFLGNPLRSAELLDRADETAKRAGLRNALAFIELVHAKQASRKQDTIEEAPALLEAAARSFADVADRQNRLVTQIEQARVSVFLEGRETVDKLIQQIRNRAAESRTPYPRLMAQILGARTSAVLKKSRVLRDLQRITLTDRFAAMHLLWWITKDASVGEQAYALFMTLHDRAPDSVQLTMREDVPMHCALVEAFAESPSREQLI